MISTPMKKNVSAELVKTFPNTMHKFSYTYNWNKRRPKSQSLNQKSIFYYLWSFRACILTEIWQFWTVRFAKFSNRNSKNFVVDIFSKEVMFQLC